MSPRTGTLIPVDRASMARTGRGTGTSCPLRGAGQHRQTWASGGLAWPTTQMAAVIMGTGTTSWARAPVEAEGSEGAEGGDPESGPGAPIGPARPRADDANGTGDAASPSRSAALPSGAPEPPVSSAARAGADDSGGELAATRRRRRPDPGSGSG